jgi:hypothetical protein
MPTVDAGAASAREPMDWEAMHREQQRQISASMAEDFKRREEIRRQHVEDALAAMKPTPLARTPEEVAELCARLEHPKLAALDDPGTPSQYPVVDLDDPTVQDTLGVSRSGSDESPRRILVMLVTFGVSRCISA